MDYCVRERGDAEFRDSEELNCRALAIFKAATVIQLHRGPAAGKEFPMQQECRENLMLKLKIKGGKILISS
jgi:hypothetical protein